MVFGKIIPEIAIEILFGNSFTVCGKSAQTESEGPPEHAIFTLPEKPLTDWASSRKTARTPRLIVSVCGVAMSLKAGVEAELTAKL